ncbi:MAG: glycoside hydrolase family 2 TIM barrel-domain containing protein, partial [Bacteroidales bacterium]|nr:glycoside hydrolase family 2 TIM barrel-domain containing protein [Bacteroidales bacterium]
MFLFLIMPSLKSQPIPVNKDLPKEQFRQEQCLNGLWDFKCDVESEWTKIRVPGSYSILQNSKWGKLLWDAFKYPKDWNNKGAIYRRSIELPKDMTRKVATFYCGACCFHTYVSMNDKPVGEFHDGFYPFEFSLNGTLNEGAKENMLMVRVSAEKELTNSGESSGNRGIQEDTYLKIYPDIYIEPNSFAIKTLVKKKQLEVNIQVNNTTGSNEKVFIRNFVTDTLGQIVKVFDGGWVDVPAKSSVSKVISDSWKNPHLWTLYDPYLYHVHTVLYSLDGKPFDKNTQRFGFREVSIDKHHLYINGEELFLHGHGGHELGNLQGTKEYMKKWLLQMKSKGVNFMRMHIYPRHQVLYEAADEVGFFLEAEGAFHFRVAKEDSVWRMNLGNMVKYQRNHPSVLLWSVSNELRWNGGGEKKYLIDYVKSLDDTRPVFASDFSLESRHGDVIGHHYNPETVFDEWAEYGPNKPMIWDEMGSVWQEDRPLYNGTAGYEVSSQDWATGMWRDGHDQILKDIEEMIDGKKINGELHRISGFIPWDLSYVFMRWQPTNRARNLWLQHDNLSGPGLKLRVVQPCSSPLNIWDKTLPEYEPNPGYYIFEKHIRTVRFFDTDDYQSYFGGGKVFKIGKLYYEDLRSADAVHCDVESLDGKILSSNVQHLNVKSGDILDKVACSFSLPEVDKVMQVNLVRRFYNKGIAGYIDKLPVKIYPSFRKMLGVLPSIEVAVVGNEKLATYLKVNGVHAFPIEKSKIGDLTKYNVVIANTPSDISGSILDRYLQSGGKVLLLNEEQKREDNLLIKK